MLVITIILWVFVLIGLINLPGYKIKDSHLLIYSLFRSIKYDIPIKDIIKLYKTRFPDEALLKGRGVTLEECVQIEFKNDQEAWRSRYVSPHNLDTFIKQIELMQQDETIKSFSPYPRGNHVKRTLISFMCCILVGSVFDLYLTSIYRYMGVPFILPLAEFIFYYYIETKYLRKISQNYDNNFQDYAIRD